MKKILNYTLSLLAGASLFASCAKEVLLTDSTANGNAGIQAETVISASLEGLKVSIVPTLPGSGAPVPTGATLTWESTDQLRVYNHADKTQYSDFRLISGEGTKTATFSGAEIAGATAYDIEILNGNVDFGEQTQPADGDPGDLKYFASATNVADLSSISLSDFSSILALTAKMPSQAIAAGVKSVEIEASEEIFNAGNTLKVTFDAVGSEDEYLNFYATLPAGSTAVPAGTTLLVKFNAPETEHTVYTRFMSLPASTFTTNKVNKISVDASNSASYANASSTGIGTSANPYLIGDKYQLLAVDGEMVAGETKYFKMIDDVDMDGESWSLLNGPSPYDRLVNFDGNNKTISNLAASFFYVFKGAVQNLTLSGCTGSSGRSGIFSQYIQGTGNTVTNVDIYNSNVPHNTNGGGLIGRINSGTSGVVTATITDCDVINTSVSGVSAAGGLLGLVEAKVVVSNCSYFGNTVTGTTQFVGGLVGKTNDDLGCSFTSCFVDNATVDASSTTGDARCGGFIGQLGIGSTISNCHVGSSTQNVLVKTGSYDSTNNKSLNSGGFVGVNYGIITKDASNNHNTAYVTVTTANTVGAALNLGGFVGFQRGTIDYSDAIVSMSDLQGQYIGGFCGLMTWQENYTTLTDHCTVSGSIRGNNYTGGFVGVAQAGAHVTSNCHVLSGTTIVGQSTAGGFAAQIKTGTFEDCTADVTLNCRGGNDGGFVGALTGGTVQRCSSAGTLNQIESTNSTFGGFAGYIEGADLTKCSSTMNLTVARSYIGGLIGVLKTANTISKCFYNGTISGPTNYKGGLIGSVDAVAAVITDCYTAGELVGSSGTQGYGGIVGELKAGASVTNCYSTMNLSHAGRATGGIVGRACSGAWPVSNESGNTVSKCIAWNANLTFDGTPSSSASSGAIIGYTSFKNTLNNCYRRADMVYKNSNTADGTTCQTSMVDQVDCDGTNWAINGNRPAGGTPAGTSATAQYQAPYYGVAAAADATVSSLAQALGWSSDVWDFTGDLPTLK